MSTTTTTTTTVKRSGIVAGLASLAFSTYLVMLLVGAVHGSVPAVPAVGFWTTLAGVVAARIAVKG